MGVTVEISTLEEMCDMMCDNRLPTPKKPKEQWWIFTFGSGQAYPGKYVKIKGTFASARQKMCDKYGTGWAFQYSAEEWEEMKKDPARFWPMEEELEVIE